MTAFEELMKRSGIYRRPFLIKLYSDDGAIVMRYINDDTDLTYNGETYSAGSFSYKPNAHVLGFDGGGTLEISIKNNLTVDLAQRYRNIRLDVIGALIDTNQVQELKKYHHHYGKASCKNGKLTFTFNADDRTQMTFPALIWNATNNHGNN